MSKAASAVSAIIFTSLLFIFPQLSAAGAANGIDICLNILLPSLFPFMIISCLISLCGAGDILSFIFLPATKLLRLPSKTAPVWLSAFIGGFPSGAHTVCSLYQLGAVEKSDAEKLISCCVCSGPAFLILSVGRNMLGSMRIGVLLFSAQMISVMLLCALFCRGVKTNTAAPVGYQSFGTALVTAVSRSSAAMMSIFAFVIFFSIVTSLLNDTLTFFRILMPFLEVTLGCGQAALLRGGASLPLIAFLNGFGGFSVCFQILSIADNVGLSPVRFWRIRLLNGILCAIIAELLMLIFPVYIPVFSTLSQQTSTVVWSADRILGGICLAAMPVMSMQKLDFTEKS